MSDLSKQLHRLVDAAINLDTVLQESGEDADRVPPAIEALMANFAPVLRSCIALSRRMAE